MTSEAPEAKIVGFAATIAIAVAVAILAVTISNIDLDGQRIIYGREGIKREQISVVVGLIHDESLSRFITQPRARDMAVLENSMPHKAEVRKQIRK